MSRLREIIAPSFYDLYYDIAEEKYTHYWLEGGRGSTKSSFVSVMIVLGIMEHPESNAVAIRRVGVNLKDSVLEQLRWAIDKLGVDELWKTKISPMELVYIPTGQKILFRGADKPQKLKSTKVSKGYIRYIWYEELAEFDGMAGIRTINQSLMRGGEKFDVFYTYNPPQTQRNWVNKEVEKIKCGGGDFKMHCVHHSTYLDVPREWLGKQFILEAEHLKNTRPDLYEHEYMGVAVGTGGEVFTNIELRRFEKCEIGGFDCIRRGVDFGYAADPFVYEICHFDKKRKRLYIFDEIYKAGLSNERAAEEIHKKGEYQQSIICDSAEPKSIAELRRYGLKTVGAKKGPDSVNYGIKFLQSLEAIVIDPIRCPEAAREFMEYELESDGNGGFKDFFPDTNNHAIDAVRYALEGDMSNRKAKILSKKDTGLY